MFYQISSGSVLVVNLKVKHTGKRAVGCEEKLRENTDNAEMMERDKGYEKDINWWKLVTWRVKKTKREWVMDEKNLLIKAWNVQFKERREDGRGHNKNS